MLPGVSTLWHKYVHTFRRRRVDTAKDLDRVLWQLYGVLVLGGGHREFNRRWWGLYGRRGSRVGEHSITAYNNHVYIEQAMGCKLIQGTHRSCS